MGYIGPAWLRIISQVRTSCNGRGKNVAVLVEGISVLVRKDAIQNKMTGGDARFRLLIPNSTFCEDEQLARVGFMDPADVESFIYELTELGLVAAENDKFIDIAVFDQQTGCTLTCDWIEFCRLPMEGGKVGAAWLYEGERMGVGVHMQSANIQLATPHGWQFKDSLSDKFQFIPEGVTHQ